MSDHGFTVQTNRKIMYITIKYLRIVSIVVRTVVISLDLWIMIIRIIWTSIIISLCGWRGWKAWKGWLTTRTFISEKIIQLISLGNSRFSMDLKKQKRVLPISVVDWSRLCNIVRNITIPIINIVCSRWRKCTWCVLKPNQIFYDWFL